MRAILRRPDFRLLFGGLVASMVAESILLLALAIWVKDLTGSDGMAGATIFAIVAPMALAPLVGWMVDRFRRREFFVAVNLCTAALLTPLYAVHDRGDVWIIYAVSALYGLSYVALSATLIGLIKEIVPGDLLAEANGALQTVKQGLRLVGPLAGAALYAGVGGWALATLGGLGFLTAAAAVSRMRVRESAPPPAQPGWLAEIGAGVRHMFGEPALRRGVLGTALTMLVLGFSESLIFAYVDRGLGHPPAFVGVLLTVQGIGGLLGGLSSATIVGRLGEVGTLATGVAIFAPAVLALVQPNLPLGFVAMVMAGFALPLVIVSLNTLTQRRTPVLLVGRVAAASEALISGPQSLSIGLGAVLVGVVDYRLLFALMAAAMLAVAHFLWSGRHLSPPQTIPTIPPVPLDALPAQSR
ncbi:MFS transporter [Micromonospora sp. NBC_01699]|uniref:MFS transporter n=1 Tax=Micromonospora sp. NBC_01699 TaxID=2975984 RepID=UPI002E2C7422|nr:MFS transporter [Micromonospora sp. NBC_01699]